MYPNSIKSIFRITFRKQVIKTAAKVGLVVGTVLNLINQGHIFTPDFFVEVQWTKLILTYCVPYLVSTYSSVATLQHTYREKVEAAKGMTKTNNLVASS